MFLIYVILIRLKPRQNICSGDVDCTEIQTERLEGIFSDAIKSEREREDWVNSSQTCRASDKPRAPWKHQGGFRNQLAHSLEWQQQHNESMGKNKKRRIEKWNALLNVQNKIHLLFHWGEGEESKRCRENEANMNDCGRDTFLRQMKMSPFNVIHRWTLLAYTKNKPQILLWLSSLQFAFSFLFFSERISVSSRSFSLQIHVGPASILPVFTSIFLCFLFFCFFSVVHHSSF